MLKAVNSKVEAKKLVAEANLQVLLEQPVGIGEHSNLVCEVEEYISKIADADDELNVLAKLIKQNPERVDG